MATVDVNYTFDTNAQGLVDGGLSAFGTFQWNAADGSPSPGSVEWNYVSAGISPQGEEAGQHPVGTTWATGWGFNAGDVVTAATLVSFRYKIPFVTFLCSFDIVDDAGTSILAGLLRPQAPSAPVSSPAWSEVVVGTTQAVNAPSQIGTAIARLKMLLNPNNSGSLVFAPAVDSVLIRLTYTPAVLPQFNTQCEIVRHSPHYSDSANAQRSIVRHG